MNAPFDVTQVSRRALLKGSHFHEVQAAVNAAMRLRSREVVGR